VGIGTGKHFSDLRPLFAVPAPVAAFSIVTLTALTGLVFGASILPKDLALAVASSIFFTGTVLVALIAYCVGNSREGGSLSYWDVAGALTLLGICAATLLDARQLVTSLEAMQLDGN
jgi:hypothetical protein